MNNGSELKQNGWRVYLDIDGVLNNDNTPPSDSFDLPNIDLENARVLSEWLSFRYVEIVIISDWRYTNTDNVWWDEILREAGITGYMSLDVAPLIEPSPNLDNIKKHKCKEIKKHLSENPVFPFEGGCFILDDLDLRKCISEFQSEPVNPRFGLQKEHLPIK
jgi:hypothetical protein